MVLDFKAELDKLIRLESEPLPGESCELAEMLAEGCGLLSSFGKKQDDISLQVEEIYDLVQAAELREGLREEKRKADKLVGAVIGLCDIIEDFYEFAKTRDDELSRQAALMMRGADRMLGECGVSRIGDEEEAGIPLNPEIHTARSAAPSAYPKEHVARVLRSGYRHNGEVIRKAVVILSSGEDEGYNE